MSLGAPGYRNIHAYSVRRKLSLTMGGRSASSARQASPSSFRLWVLRKGSCRKTRSAFRLFSAACWQRYKATSARSLTRATSAARRSLWALARHWRVSSSRNSLGVIEEPTFPNHRRWQRGANIRGPPFQSRLPARNHAHGFAYIRWQRCANIRGPPFKIRLPPRNHVHGFAYIPQLRICAASQLLLRGVVRQDDQEIQVAVRTGVAPRC